MAGRPVKQGIDYFPLDVDFFSDIKVRKIVRACGPQSASILICLLCNIYKNEGYYILWDDDLPFVIADIVGVSEGAVKEVLTKAVQVGFFDAEIYSVHRVLTSAGIQKRFLLATYQRKKTEINPEYLIICTNNSINHANNSINHVNNAQSKKKNKKKISTDVDIKESPASASPVALYPLEEIQTLLPRQQIWTEAMCREFGISLPQLLEFIDSYIQELKLSGVTAKTLPDSMAHCRNLMRKRRQLEKQGATPAKSWKQQLCELAVDKFNTPDDINTDEKPFWQ